MEALIDALNAHPDISEARTSKYYRLGMLDNMTAVRATVSRWEWSEDCMVVVEVSDVLLNEHGLMQKIIMREAYGSAWERGYRA